MLSRVHSQLQFTEVSLHSSKVQLQLYVYASLLREPPTRSLDPLSGPEPVHHNRCNRCGGEARRLTDSFRIRPSPSVCQLCLFHDGTVSREVTTPLRSRRWRRGQAGLDPAPAGPPACFAPPWRLHAQTRRVGPPPAPLLHLTHLYLL